MPSGLWFCLGSSCFSFSSLMKLNWFFVLTRLSTSSNELKEYLMSSSMCSFQGTCVRIFILNGDGEIRTLDPLLARQVLSQLSYTPILA